MKMWCIHKTHQTLNEVESFIGVSLMPTGDELATAASLFDDDVDPSDLTVDSRPYVAMRSMFFHRFRWSPRTKQVVVFGGAHDGNAFKVSHPTRDRLTLPGEGEHAPSEVFRFAGWSPGNGAWVFAADRDAVCASTSCKLSLV